MRAARGLLQPPHAHPSEHISVHAPYCILNFCIGGSILTLISSIIAFLFPLMGMKLDFKSIKRAPSPIYTGTSNEKKAKRDHNWDEDEYKLRFAVTKNERSPTYDPELLTFGEDHRCGVEFRHITRSAESQVANTTIAQTVRELAIAGKRLVQPPRLLDDGVRFDWTLDDSAKQESVDTLLAASGLDSGTLGTVLQRVTTSSSGGGSSRDTAAMIIDLLSDHESDVDDNSSVKLLGSDGADVAHAIVIDSDEDEGHEGHEPPEQLAQSNTDTTTRIHARPGRPVYSVAGEAGPSQLRRVDADDCEAGETIDRARCPKSSDSDQNSCSPHDQRAERVVPKHHELYGSFKILASSSDNDSSSSEEETEEPSGRPQRTMGSRELAKKSQYVALHPVFEGRSRVQMASSNRSGDHDQPLHEPDSPRVDEPVGTPAGSADRGARAPSSNIIAGPLSRTPLRRTSRPYASRYKRQTAIEEQESDSRQTSSSEDSVVFRPPDRATQHRAAGRPALRRNSARARAALFGVSTPINRHEVNIPKAEFARARRLLAPIDREIPYTTITMRGDASFIDKQRLSRISAFSLPFYQPDRARPALVADACLVGDDKVVVGYEKGPCQVSLILLGDQHRPRRIDLAYRAHSTVQENLHLGTSRPNPGISTLAPLGGSQLRFLSGGYDRTVRLWAVRRTDDQWKTKSDQLDLHQSQFIQALAYRSVDETIFSCGGPFISQMSIKARRAPKPTRVSDGRVLQIHVHPQNPQVVILEVDHLENQVLVYDTRRSGFDCRPTLQFGHRGDATTDNIRRFTKGSALNSLFARPYNDSEKGLVRVWDYRKTGAVVACFQEERPVPVVHAVLAGSDLLAYGGPSVTIWKAGSSRD